jgi:DNA-binding transcriptional regulator GbsR (MarR family)
MDGAPQPSLDIMPFVERLAHFFRLESQLPRNVARVLAYLLVCSPEHQTAEQLANRLQISSGGVSGAVNTLEQVGLVRRFTVRGDRRHYYAMQPGGWASALELRLRSVHHAIELADEGLRLSAGNKRLEDMKAIYGVFDDQVEVLLKRLRQR